MKKILIIDERSFSRVCSAILELDGHKTEILEKAKGRPTRLNIFEFNLIITSYPFAQFMFDDIKKTNLPKIILTDQISGDVIDQLGSLNNAYCMVKPLDYPKFKSLINQILTCDMHLKGFSIL